MKELINIILIIASDGFQPVEYNVPKQILEANGYNVLTASDKTPIANSSSLSIKAQVDMTVDKIDFDKTAGIFLIGGPGALEHLDNPTVYKVVQEANELGKLVGAICISPRILAHAGILTGKKATGWDADNKLDYEFKQYEVKRINLPVVVDGKIITASGPAAAKEFGEEIVKLLKKS